MARFTPGREPDTIAFEWEDADGGLNVATFDLDQAAALQRGERVAGFGLTEYYSPADRIAAARARLDQIAERKAEMRREFPGIDRGADS